MRQMPERISFAVTMWLLIKHILREFADKADAKKKQAEEETLEIPEGV